MTYSNDKKQSYTFQQVDEQLYCVTPCPPNFQILENVGNVFYVEPQNNNSLLVKCENWESMEDLVVTLNSTIKLNP
jgi:hypothetical protein